MSVVLSAYLQRSLTIVILRSAIRVSSLKTTFESISYEGGGIPRFPKSNFSPSSPIDFDSKKCFVVAVAGRLCRLLARFYRFPVILSKTKVCLGPVNMDAYFCIFQSRGTYFKLSMTLMYLLAIFPSSGSLNSKAGREPRSLFRPSRGAVTDPRRRRG